MSEFKVVLLGMQAVGKTSLVHRYIHNKFSEDMALTFGVSYFREKVVIDNRQLQMVIWDTAGCERFDSISRLYYRRANAAIVCVDLTLVESFAKMKQWVEELQKNEEQCRIYICCTKKDYLDKNARSQLTSSEMIEEYAKIIDAKVYMTSSKTGENVYEMFQDIAADLVNAEKAEKGIRIVLHNVNFR